METAAYVSPLNEFGLQELGRLAVNFGHVEFLLDQRLYLLSGIADPYMRTALISPLATRRKLEIIEASLDRTVNAEARALVKEACSLIDKANGARNDLLHGFWAFDTESEPAGTPALRTTKKPKNQPLDVALISSVADEAAKATRLLVTAMWIANGITPFPFPVRLFSGEQPPPGWLPPPSKQ